VAQWQNGDAEILENASMKNVSTKRDISQGWKMQVLKTQVSKVNSV